MKVVKQKDYRHKHSFDDSRSGGLGDIEQDFFLPRNLSQFSSDIDNQLSLKSARRRFDDDYNSNSENYFDNIDEDTDTKAGVERAKIKAVFEVPRKPLSNYSKWSRWSKCSSKCTTRRFKKCRPHARHICGNDVIREIAYCYTEGSFCEEWISSQINKINAQHPNEIPTRRTTTTTTTTTMRAPRASRRTDSPLLNTISPNFYSSFMSNGRRKNKTNPEYRPQNLQCGFPSIRNKNSDFTLKIIGGRVAKRGAVSF